MTKQDNWISVCDIESAVVHLAHTWRSVGYEEYCDALEEYSKRFGCTELYLKDLHWDLDSIIDKWFHRIKMPQDYPEHFGYMPNEQ